jgi:hypothetical protein
VCAPLPKTEQSHRVTQKHLKAEAKTMSNENRSSGVSDDNIRAIRDRLSSAKKGVDIAMQYTMWSEVREELRKAQSDLAMALSCIGK